MSMFSLLLWLVGSAYAQKELDWKVFLSSRLDSDNFWTTSPYEKKGYRHHFQGDIRIISIVLCT